jgi:hypothetical protein
MYMLNERRILQTEYFEAIKQIQHAENASIIMVCWFMEEKLMYIGISVFQIDAVRYFVFIRRCEPVPSDAHDM